MSEKHAEKIEKDKVDFDEFDDSYFQSLEDKDNISIRENGIYHTIVVNGQKAGIVGFIPFQSGKEQGGFVQIVISLEFRGRGLVKKVEDQLAGKYGLKELYATIKKYNVASIKAHENAGFEMINEERANYLREKGFLKKDEIRMLKRIKKD